MVPGLLIVGGLSVCCVGEGLTRLSWLGTNASKEAEKLVNQGPDAIIGIGLGCAGLSVVFAILAGLGAMTCMGAGVGAIVAGVAIVAGYASYSTISAIAAGALAGLVTLYRLVRS